MRIVLHNHIPENDLLRRQWNELVAQMARPEVFYTYEWAMSVSRAYQRSMSPILVLAYQRETLAGVAAFGVDADQKATFLAGNTADYCDFITTPAMCQEFADATFAELQNLRISNLTLPNLPADSATAWTLQAAARRRGYSVFSRPAYDCCQVELKTAEQRESTLRSLGQRKWVRRCLRVMSQKAAVTVTHSRSWGETEPLLQGFTAAHIARFVSTGRRSNLDRAERREFLYELAKALAVSGSLTLSRLLVGDRAIAWNYGFQFAGSWFWYMPTFDTEWQQYSPGFCLLSKILEEACGRADITLFDLGLGAEDYKDRVATHQRQSVHVTIADTRARCAMAAARHYGAAALSTIPWLDNQVRAARTHIQSMQQHFRAPSAAS